MPKRWPFGKQQSSQSTTLQTPLWGVDMQPDLKQHFAYVERLQNAPASQQEAIAKEMVRFAPQSIRGFEAEYVHREQIHDQMRWLGAGRKPPMEPFMLPTHPGFQRLAINAEKAKDYGRAIVLCEEAKRQGWNGDWDKRIERCRTKAAN